MSLYHIGTEAVTPFVKGITVHDGFEDVALEFNEMETIDSVNERKTRDMTMTKVRQYSRRYGENFRPEFLKFYSLNSLLSLQDLFLELGSPKVQLLQTVHEDDLNREMNWDEVVFEFDDKISHIPKFPGSITHLKVDCSKNTLGRPLLLPLNSWKVELPNLLKFSFISEEGSSSIPLDLYLCPSLKTLDIKFLDCFEAWLPNLRVHNGIENIQIVIQNDSEGIWYTESMFSKLVEIRIGQLPHFALKSLRIIYPKGVVDNGISLNFERFSFLQRLAIVHCDYGTALKQGKLSPRKFIIPETLEYLEIDNTFCIEGHCETNLKNSGKEIQITIVNTKSAGASNHHKKS